MLFCIFFTLCWILFFVLFIDDLDVKNDWHSDRGGAFLPCFNHLVKWASISEVSDSVYAIFFWIVTPPGWSVLQVGLYWILQLWLSTTSTSLMASSVPLLSLKMIFFESFACYIMLLTCSGWPRFVESCLTGSPQHSAGQPEEIWLK